MKRAELTQDQLKHVLRYEPDTGTFYWRVRQANCVHVGQVAGSIRKCGYCVIGIGNRTFKAHRLAWLYVVGDLPPGIVIDHINNDPSDNRIANLRVASVAQNKRNERIRSDNTSSFKGVAFDPRSGKWRARIGIGGKRICLGRHDDPRQAYEAYCRAAISTFGEFARLA